METFAPDPIVRHALVQRSTQVVLVHREGAAGMTGGGACRTGIIAQCPADKQNLFFVCLFLLCFFFAQRKTEKESATCG